MQRIRLERRAAGRAPDPAQLARPPGIDGDFDEEDADRDQAQRRRRAAGLDAVERLHGHAAGEQQEQRREPQRRDVLELSVPVSVRRVGRPVAEPDGEPGDAGREEIDARMDRRR